MAQGLNGSSGFRTMMCLAVVAMNASALFGNDKESIIHDRVDRVAHGDVFAIVSDAGKRVIVHHRATDSPDTGQPFSQESKEALSKLIAGKAVDVHWSEKDGAGRVIGDFYIDDILINLQMVEDGWAWYFKDHLESDELEQAEKEAREAHRGLRAQKSPQAPWEYRESKRVAVDSTKKVSKAAKVEEPDTSPVASSAESPALSGGTVHVKDHYRRTKSGKTVWVKPHTRRN